MNIKRLLCPDISKAPSLLLSDNSSCGGLIWETGMPIDTNDIDLSRLEFTCETLPSKSMTDFALSDAGCIVVSEKLKNALDENQIDNIDYYPATVVLPKEDSTQSGYYAANIKGLVDAIDLDKSEYRAIERKGRTAIVRMEKLVLKDVEASHSSIYRLKMFRSPIIVEGKLCSYLSENSFSGIKLVDPEEWDGI